MTSSAGAAGQRLSAAKLWVTADEPGGRLPYLATALFSLTTVVTDDVDLLVADEHWRLYANPDAVLTAAVPDLGIELAHLVWHLLFDHAARARSVAVTPATARAWATATHVVIGETLDASGMSQHGLVDGRPHRELVPGRSAEEHYARLSRLPAQAAAASDRAGQLGNEGCGSSGDGLPRRYELPATEAEGALSTLTAQGLRTRVAIEFREQIRSRGAQSGEHSRWVQQICQPRLPWPQLLAAAVRRSVAWCAGQQDYTYGRVSRRQSAVSGVRLPGMRRPLPAVAVVVDTSGSVDDELLAQALGEVDGAIRGSGVRGESVSVVVCDAGVQSVGQVRAAREVVLGGGGGTDLRVGIAAAEALRPRPEVVVVLSDGFTPWPDRPPAGAVLVAGILGREGHDLPATPPWATRVECRLV